MANGVGSHWSLSTKLGLGLWELTGAMFVYNVRKDGLMGLGLGVEVLGTVMDKRALRTSALWLGGGLVSLVSTLLAISQDEAAIASTNGDCSLSAAEKAGIRALLGIRSTCFNASSFF